MTRVTIKKRRTQERLTEAWRDVEFKPGKLRFISPPYIPVTEMWKHLDEREIWRVNLKNDDQLTGIVVNHILDGEEKVGLEVLFFHRHCDDPAQPIHDIWLITDKYERGLLQRMYSSSTSIDLKQRLLTKSRLIDTDEEVVRGI